VLWGWGGGGGGGGGGGVLLGGGGGGGGGWVGGVGGGVVGGLGGGWVWGGVVGGGGGGWGGGGGGGVGGGGGGGGGVVGVGGEEKGPFEVKILYYQIRKKIKWVYSPLPCSIFPFYGGEGRRSTSIKSVKKGKKRGKETSVIAQFSLIFAVGLSLPGLMEWKRGREGILANLRSGKKNREALRFG